MGAAASFRDAKPRFRHVANQPHPLSRQISVGNDFRDCVVTAPVDGCDGVEAHAPLPHVHHAIPVDFGVLTKLGFGFDPGPLAQKSEQAGTYLCNVEVDSSGPSGTRRKQVSQLRLVKGSERWVLTR